MVVDTSVPITAEDLPPAFRVGDIVYYTRRHWPSGHPNAGKLRRRGPFKIIKCEELAGRRRRDGSDYPTFHITPHPGNAGWHIYASADELEQL